MERFQIYFKMKNKNVHILTITRVDEETNTYKLKKILEVYNSKNGTIEKHKIKEFKIGVDEIKQKIEKIDFNRKVTPVIDYDKPYCQISYGDKKIQTSEILEIKDFLDIFNFMEIIEISKNEYGKVKNIYEYIKLRKILLEKCSKVEDDKVSIIINKFLNEDPYELFEKFEYFDKFIESL